MMAPSMAVSSKMMDMNMAGVRSQGARSVDVDAPAEEAGKDGFFHHVRRDARIVADGDA